MKKIILAIFAAVCCTACNLGSLNYPSEQDNRILVDLSERMAYDCLSLPIQIMNSLKDEEFLSPDLNKIVSANDQQIAVSRVPGVPSTWEFKTVSSYDDMVIHSFLTLLPSQDLQFWTWEATGECDYVEDSGYQAVLIFKTPVEYTWQETFINERSRFEKYLVATGTGIFTTGDSKDKILDNFLFSMQNKEVVPEYSWRIEGELLYVK